MLPQVAAGEPERLPATTVPQAQKRSPMSPYRPTAGFALVFMLAVVAPLVPAQVQLLPPATPVSDATEVERLLQGGRLAEALARVDRALADKPADAQLRFLRGVILAEAKRGDEAAAVFEKLTQDYPELPEPYNNLAVLHAAAGRYAQARAALEQAIRLNPGYSTAHENLGDVLARLAGESYERARQLDAGNRTAGPKLAVLGRLFVLVPAAAAPAAAPPAAGSR